MQPQRKPLHSACAGVCVICRRRHDNIGWQATRHHPIKWFCREDAQYIRTYAEMPKTVFDRYESDSIMEGGAAAGQYLDELGQTDLAELDTDQFRTFFVRFMTGYEKSMRGAFERVEGK